METTSDIEQLVRDIRQKKILPKQLGLLKYDLPATVTRLQEIVFTFVFAFVVLVPTALLAGAIVWPATPNPSLRLLFSVLLYIAVVSLIVFLGSRFLPNYGERFILLTPTHLVEVQGRQTVFFEWSRLSELGLEADAQQGPDNIKVEGWPITWTDKELEKREDIHISRSEKEGLDLLIEAKEKVFFEQYALKYGNRQLTFTYEGKKCAVEIPAGADIQTLASFVNLYWTKLNPGARKKGIVYL